MKQHIEDLLHTALIRLQEDGIVIAIPTVIEVEVTKDKKHGDFASNIALLLAKPSQKKPQEMADYIMKALPASPYVVKVEKAGPGFINFFLSSEALLNAISKIITEKENYGRCELGRGKTVLVEFVSSNPTGPLHVGHGRHAAFGDALANLLDAVGFKAYREYYVNDAGRQMDIVAVSIWLRYLSLCGEHIHFPDNAYQGAYISEIAELTYQQYGKRFQKDTAEFFRDLPLDESQGGDKEVYIDAIVTHAKKLLGADYHLLIDKGLETILADIREDLSEFGVHFQNWFSERKLVAEGVVERLIERLRQNGYIYEQEGALWFRSTDFGDEKDRVLIRSNGQATYFANDAAYHINKFERGFDLAIDIFGADHHGYTARIKAIVEACGINPERLMYLLLQFVSLYREGQQVSMSTRGGNFVTLRELRQEVGNDVARFFYVMRKCEQHIDFNLDLAKAQSSENPVYYVQYAYARICSIFKQAAERQFVFDENDGLSHLSLLNESIERQLLNTLTRYPDMILTAALHYEPNQVTHYLRELAADFHAYYNAYPFLVDDSHLRNARLVVIAATRQILANGLFILGVSTPQSM